MLQKCSINMSRYFLELFMDMLVIDSIVIPQMVCFKREVELNQLASKVDVMLKHMKFEGIY